MTDNYIQLQGDKDLLTLKIKTDKGELTGEELVFDLQDIELPLIYQDMLFKIQKNKEKLHNDFLVIDKRPDLKGKKLLSKNDEDRIKAYSDFTNKMVETYNMFLGPNGVQKLLNGRKLGWTTMAEIDEIIDKQIAPQLTLTAESVAKKIVEKYNNKDNGELK